MGFLYTISTVNYIRDKSIAVKTKWEVVFETLFPMNLELVSKDNAIELIVE